MDPKIAAEDPMYFFLQIESGGFCSGALSDTEDTRDGSSALVILSFYGA